MYESNHRNEIWNDIEIISRMLLNVLQLCSHLIYFDNGDWRCGSALKTLQIGCFINTCCRWNTYNKMRLNGGFANAVKVIRWNYFRLSSFKEITLQFSLVHVISTFVARQVFLFEFLLTFIDKLKKPNYLLIFFNLIYTISIKFIRHFSNGDNY